MIFNKMLIVFYSHFRCSFARQFRPIASARNSSSAFQIRWFYVNNISTRTTTFPNRTSPALRSQKFYYCESSKNIPYIYSVIMLMSAVCRNPFQQRLTIYKSLFSTRTPAKPICPVYFTAFIFFYNSPTSKNIILTNVFIFLTYMSAICRCSRR